MSLALPVAALALGCAPGLVSDMHDEPPAALSLAVNRSGDQIEVQLIGQAAEARQVSYLLEVSGPSNSRHRGTTRLAANARAVLSTIRTNAGADWCVRLLAEEEGRAPYEIREGTCSGMTPD